jgi:hypothetical protein
MNARRLWLVAVAVAAASASARGQSSGDFDLSWGRAGAGGVSRGGDWEICGTAGQAGAGTARNGAWAVQGGFWNRVSANLSPVAGVATFARANNMSLKIRISQLLTSASDPDGDTPVLAGAGSPSTNGATITANGTYVFYTPPAINGNVTDRFSYQVRDDYQGLGAGTVQVMMAGSTELSPNISAITTLPDGNKQLRLAGIPSYYYLVQAATNMTPPTNWVTLATNQADGDGLWNYDDLDATNFPSRYYRMAVP